MSFNDFICRTDPVRPFISGHVANSMAAEVIALLHGLLTVPENLAAQTWAAAVEGVRCTRIYTFCKMPDICRDMERDYGCFDKANVVKLA